MKKFLAAINRQLPFGVKRFFKKMIYNGNARFCPICECNVRHFNSYGLKARPNAQCPVCGSLERHRLVWLFLQKQTDLLESRTKKLLHIAPEYIFSVLFKRIRHLDYLTADLFNPIAMVKMDITDIQYPEETFDIIYCSHVFEHIPDDQKAMREFYRVLKNTGWAILQVPISGEKTFEDPSVQDPAERERLFGQDDHVRIYGNDYIERLIEAGFTVKTYRPEDVVGKENLERLGIGDEEPVFFCTKSL